MTRYRTPGIALNLLKITKYRKNIATSEQPGGIKLGYIQTEQNYPVHLDSNDKAYVNIPTANSNEINGIF